MRLEVIIRVVHMMGSQDSGFMAEFWGEYIAVVNFLDHRSSTIMSSTDGGAFIRSWILFKKHLYQCRCLIEMNQFKQSKKEIKNALELFQREIRVIDLHQDSHKSSSSSLGKSFFGCPMPSIDTQNSSALHIKVNHYSDLSFIT